MGPMIQATYGRLLIRANSVWIMILQTRSNWAPHLPPIDLAPAVESEDFLNDLLPRVYNTTQEIVRLKNALRVLKLTKLTYEAMTAYFDEFDLTECKRVLSPPVGCSWLSVSKDLRCMVSV
jgi:hypothetical protein